MYRLLKPLLFHLDPETAHGLTMKLLDLAYATGLLRLIVSRPRAQPVDVMGLRFPNRIGLAAGLDKNGDHVDALAACGFGFVELGTVTPRPQPGNDRPRMFRLVDRRAIINRMGFNNKGVDYLAARVKRSRRECIIGINIGKNKSTPNAQALDDYLACLRAAWTQADYIVVNISSPNTPGLRELQQQDELFALLDGLREERERLQQASGRQVPLAVKIAPDLGDDELADMVDVFKRCAIDAVIATNTTNDREAIAGHPLAGEQGGLSGLPLQARADQVLHRLVELLDGAMPVIAVGGVMSAEDAVRKIRLGAALVQVYTGFIYAGPELVGAAVAATDKS